MSSFKVAFCALLCVAGVCTPRSAIRAEGLAITWSSFNSAGAVKVAATQNLLSYSVGQGVAGAVSDSSLIGLLGFWAGETPVPVVIQRLADAKMLDDGTLVSIAGRVASSAAGEYDGFLYIQDPDRTSGIRVAAPLSALQGVARGSIVNVIGRLGTTANQERQIVGPVVVVTGSTTPPRPYTMRGTAVGGGGLESVFNQTGPTGGKGTNNVGLLIRTFGRVVATVPGFAVLDDGSRQFRVDTSFGCAPTSGQYLTVVGVSSLYFSGETLWPQLLPRNAADLSPQ